MRGGWSQYCRLRSSVMRSPGIHSTKRYGPVPTGLLPNLLPQRLTAAGDTIAAGPIARLARNGA